LALVISSATTANAQITVIREKSPRDVLLGLSDRFDGFPGHTLNLHLANAAVQMNQSTLQALQLQIFASISNQVARTLPGHDAVIMIPGPLDSDFGRAVLYEIDAITDPENSDPSYRVLRAR